MRSCTGRLDGSPRDDVIANTSGLSDGLLDSAGGTLPAPQFNGADVGAAPEPGTGVLLSVGLVGIAMWRLRRMRS